MPDPHPSGPELARSPSSSPQGAPGTYCRASCSLCWMCQFSVATMTKCRVLGDWRLEVQDLGVGRVGF